MYRTRFASLRCPDLDDTNPETALRNLATDIQYHAERNAARVEELKRRRGVYVYGDGTALPSGALTTAVWDGEDYDTDGYFDPAVSTSYITVPKGVFLVSASCTINGGGPLNFAYMIVIGSVFVPPIAVNQNGPFTYDYGSPITATGILPSSATQTVTVKCFQSSAGAGTINGQRLKVAKIGLL
jgi:hypothetical protein